MEGEVGSATTEHWNIWNTVILQMNELTSLLYILRAL